jgi:hypothetical protein
MTFLFNKFVNPEHQNTMTDTSFCCDAPCRSITPMTSLLNKLVNPEHRNIMMNPYPN